MKGTDNEKRFCADCVYYRAHYTKSGTYFCRLARGHCVQGRLKEASERGNACGKFVQKDEKEQKHEREISVLGKLERIHRTLQELLSIFSNED